jgi:class 3 adenylate cyclase
MGVINTFNSLSIGLVLFLFTQSILIAMRFSKAFVKSEELGKTLLTMNSSLKRFIPEQFFRLLHRSEISDIRLGDQVEQNMTVMFADIRSFTGLAEQLGAAGTFTFLNDYFSRVGAVIRDNLGFIDKYMGDGFIALFPGSPDNALQAAVGIQKAVSEFNASRSEHSCPPIEVGIGLNYGPLVLGTVGEETRMDTTVIADAVNLCSRLESLTKVYGKGAIIPFSFLDRLENPEIFHWRYLGLIRVQGRKQPVEAIHVYDGLTDVDFTRFAESKARFEDSLSSYRNGEYELAMEGFRALARDYPEDPAPFTFMTQIRRLVSSGLADEWDGIESLPAK